MLTTVFVSIASTFLLLIGVAGAWALIVSGKSTPQPTTEVQPTGYLQELAARLGHLEVLVNGLPSLWEEERERTLKFANRAYASEKRTRELLADDEDDEDDEEETQRILELNAIRSDASGVLPMHDGVENPVDADLLASANAVLGQGL